MTIKKETEPMTTYMLIMQDGSKQKITCPTAWTATFGPLMPGSKDQQYNGHKATSLRFRDGARQKAVFTDVASFRDMSIAIEVEETKSKQETYFKEDGNGKKKQVIVEGSVKEWINPDAPRPKGEEDTSEMGKLLKITQEKN